MRGQRRVSAWQDTEQVQGLRGRQHLSAWQAKECVQGLRRHLDATSQQDSCTNLIYEAPNQHIDIHPGPTGPCNKHKRAGAAAFVSMAGEGVCARIAGAAAFVSMAGEGGRARIAGYCCLTFYRSVYLCDLNEMHHRTHYMSIKLAGRKCTMQRPQNADQSISQSEHHTPPIVPSPPTGRSSGSDEQPKRRTAMMTEFKPQEGNMMEK